MPKAQPPRARAPQPGGPKAAAPKAAAPKAAAPKAAAPKAAAPKAAAPKAAAPKAAAPKAAAPRASEIHSGTAAPGANPPKTSESAAAKAAARTDRSARPARWVKISAVIIGLAVVFGLVVLAARWLTGTEPVAGVLARYPGTAPTPPATPKGFPAWLNWAHFFNLFFMALILRTGLSIRRQRRPVTFWAPYWNRNRKIDLTLWLHLSIDVLWVANGIFYIVMLFASGHWMRIVPTSWEVVPNAVSAGLQYLTLDWPTEHAWVHYNGLQQLFYFCTVFIAAPLAIISGVRMSEWWPKRWPALNKAYPLSVARALHVPVMIYFVVFIIAHTTLIFTTGVIGHLNAMFAAQDSATSWLGPALFALAMVVTAAAVVAARPLVLAPLARLTGEVTAR